ncbi:DeoR/GlpR family DNA-binding transcription regulator [Roseovarius arcticus]|uniref:DeoR/GlpR family DNA-binding transcription regulator n=1 Tax=Roseovarius arcticus TaxID=2547404 RepID=UPI0011101B30|nr:DeoR/GlpR family DNA-binding transcription regulator [Roseovarius arcticus]
MNHVPTHSHREIELLDMVRRLGGSARSAELAKSLDVSEETVRRTIKALSKAGALERVRGGACLATSQNAPSFFRRISEYQEEKRAIASAVAGRVSDRMTLFLDVGSTTAFVAEELRKHLELTVVTNSIGVAQALAGHNGNRVHLLGGEMMGEERGTFGFVTENQARRFAFDMAILGANALSSRQGFLFLSASDASLANVVAACADRVLFALNSQKFNQTAPHCGPDPRAVDELVTDALPDSKITSKLHGWGIEVTLAK